MQLDLDRLDELEEGTAEELPSVPSRPVKAPEEEEEELPSVPPQPVAAKQKRQERGNGDELVGGPGVIYKRDVGGVRKGEWRYKILMPQLRWVRVVSLPHIVAIFFVC